MSRKTNEIDTQAERRIPLRGLLLTGLAAAALAGCATPDYPIKQGYAPPPAIKPKYPIDRKDQAPANPPPAATNPPPSDDPPPAASAPQAAMDSAAQTESAPSTTTAAPASTAVESAPLAPIPTAPPSTPPGTTPVSTAPVSTTGATPAPAPPTAAPVSAPVTATTPPVATPTPAAPPPASAAPTPPKPAYQPPAYTPPAYTPPRPERRTETRLTTDGKVVAARGMYRDYLVREGDHLDAIGRDLETTRDELIRANHLKKPYRIHPGEHIRVPVAKAYVAESGDTLTGIAKRFGVTLGELADLNDLPSHDRLAPGMYIALPEHFEDHGPGRETFTEEVYERPATTYRPQATYQAANRAPAAPSTPAYVPGTPYTPSPEALAAAAARREALNRPTTSYPTTTYPTARTPEPAEGPIDTAKLASLGVGKFIWPVKGSVVSPFGAAGMGRRNDGLDIGAPEGSEVRVAAVGEVVYAGDQVPGFGNLVLIKHAGGWVSAYAHLAQVDVHMRDTVYQGQQIGTVGESGGASQPELHFELRYAATPEDKAKPLDPMLVLPR